MIKKIIQALIVGLLGTPQALALTLTVSWWGNLGYGYSTKGWPLSFRYLDVTDKLVVWEFSYFGLLIDWMFWTVVVLIVHWWLIKRWGKKQILWTIFVGVSLVLSWYMVQEINFNLNIIGFQQLKLVKTITPKKAGGMVVKPNSNQEKSRLNNKPVLTDKFYVSVAINYPRIKFEEILEIEGLALVTELPDNIYLVRLTDNTKYSDTITESDYIKNKYEVVDMVKPLYECDSELISLWSRSNSQLTRQQTEDICSGPKKSTKYYTSKDLVQIVDESHQYIEVFDEVVEIKSRDLVDYMQLLINGLGVDDLKLAEYHLLMTDTAGKSDKISISVYSPSKDLGYKLDSVSGKYIISSIKQKMDKGLVDVKRMKNSSDLVNTATKNQGNCPSGLEIYYTNSDMAIKEGKTMISCPGVWMEFIGAER